MSDRYLTAYDLVDAEAREAWGSERPASDYDPDPEDNGTGWIYDPRTNAWAPDHDCAAEDGLPCHCEASQ